MSRITEQRRLLDEYRIAEATAGALEDISALRLASIRSGFEKNRSFYAGIRDLYGVVRTFGAKEAAVAPKSKKQRQLLVAITSNKRFYGKLMREVIGGLARSLAQLPGADALAVGRVGWQYIEQENLAAKARQMLWQDDMPTAAEFDEILAYFERYDRVLVLYPKFINPFRQDVGVEDITQTPQDAIPGPSGEGGAPGRAAEETGYIFEPEVPKILAFFDAQVQRVLLQGVLLEAELARTAARLIRLEESQERAHTLVVRGEARLRHESAALADTELLETFAGFSRWHSV